MTDSVSVGTETKLRRLIWRVATVAAIREETVSARTLVLDVPDWPGHLAGQHVDVRLTAEDGYSTERSYSLASDPSTVELMVQRVSRGEVSPYLCDVAGVGDQFELRGPVGGYFTWSPSRPEPVLLLAGGSGITPLMSMIRTRAAADNRVPFRLVYSVRDPDVLIYADELPPGPRRPRARRDVCVHPGDAGRVEPSSRPAFRHVAGGGGLAG